MTTDASRALVLFSGGQDSTVCLAWALQHHDHVETVGFDYGQRHAVELAARPRILMQLRAISSDWSRRLGQDHVLDLRSFGAIGETAMTTHAPITQTEDGSPNTFVPARNLAFFVHAAALGYRRGINALVGGMCETDYSGYPDCRDATLKALAHAMRLGIDQPIEIITPLMRIDKAQTWALADQLGGKPLVDMIVEETHTCYLGSRAQRHAWGYGCGHCPACRLRARGWDQWISDHRH